MGSTTAKVSYMTELLAFGSLDSSSYLHPLDCCIQSTPLRLYSRENTVVIPRKMIAFKLAAEVVTSLVAPTHLSTSTNSIIEVLEWYLTLTAFFKLLINIILLTHICSQHSFVGEVAK